MTGRDSGLQAGKETKMDGHDLWKLTGIVIVVVGLFLRLRTTLVVVAAALITGIIAGLPLFSDAPLLHGLSFLTGSSSTGEGAAPEGIINMLGRAFAENRLVTLFLITLPAIGLAERFGLQEQAAALIRRFRAASVGRLQILYQLLRILMGILGLRLNGHAAFVRPLVYPMAIGAAEKQAAVGDPEELADDKVEAIKAASAASENYGNFYGQNLSPVQAGILLVYGTLKGLGHEPNLARLVLFAIPITTVSVLLGAVQFLRLDRKLSSEKTERQQ
jgi:uncharacterized membrane protein